MSLTLRFASNLLALVLGESLTLAAFAFGRSATAAIGLGAGAAVIVAVLAGFATAGRGAGQRTLDLVTVLGAAWTVVAARVFSGGTLKWLCVADGLLLLGLGLIGLVAHEASLERRLLIPARDGRALNGAVPGPGVPTAELHEQQHAA